MHIRDAVLADRDAIVAFDHVAQLEPERVAFIDRALRSKTCLVAEHDRAVIAYAVLDYSFYGNGFVPLVYVAPSARRLGAGRALMESLAARCKTDKLFTSTNQSNEPMQQLLTRLGYESSGVIYNLDPGDPELVYFRHVGAGAD
jgi:GNAT superfamily N-acetyltransferase